VPRRLALVSLLCSLAIAGCGGSGERPTPAALNLSREDLLAVCRALELAEPTTAAEVAATKQAWPSVTHGLPLVIDPATQRTIEAAAASAAAIRVPAQLTQVPASALTGPGSGIGGLFRSYLLLSSRGWRMIVAAVNEIQHGSPAAARFARANVALYIDSVYDAHFALAQIGKKLIAGYKTLGGPQKFTALAPGRVSTLAGVYSEREDRLHPHVGVRLGA
jgi:hypothetical protein